MLNKELLLVGSSKPLEYYSAVDEAPFPSDDGTMSFLYIANFEGYDIKWNLDGVVFPLRNIYYVESDGLLNLEGDDGNAIPKKGASIKVTNVKKGGTASFVFDGKSSYASVTTDSIGLLGAYEITAVFDPKPV